MATRGPTRRWSLNYKKIFGTSKCPYGKLNEPKGSRICKKKPGPR